MNFLGPNGEAALVAGDLDHPLPTVGDDLVEIVIRVIDALEHLQPRTLR